MKRRRERNQEYNDFLINDGRRRERARSRGRSGERRLSPAPRRERARSQGRSDERRTSPAARVHYDDEFDDDEFYPELAVASRSNVSACAL